MSGKNWGEINELDPKLAVAILADRVATLTKEKEAIERDLEKEREARVKENGEFNTRLIALEGTYNKGVGIVLALTFVGGLVGFFVAYGKAFLKAISGGPG